MDNKKNKKRVLLNIATNIIYELVVLFFGLVLPRLYLVNFGSDVNGLDSTIKNIFAYLALLEAGVGLSAQYALYGPVAKNDKKTINEILAATRIFYLRSGILYTILTFAFALIYPLVIKSNLDYFTVFMVVILYGVPGIVLFLLRGKYTAFLEVKGKQFVLTTLSSITLIFSNVLRLVLLLFTTNLILVQATYCLPSVIQIVFVVIYVKKRYPWVDWKSKPDMGALTQKKSVLIHQLSSVIFSNTDSVIISVITGMNYVSVYAVYSMFYKNIMKLVRAFTNGITFKFGQTYQSDREQFKKDFSTYETVYYMLLFVAYTVLTSFLMPVIRLYTSGLADSAIYDSNLILIMFSITFLLFAIELPQSQLISVSGSFTATQRQAVIEMVINIVVSIFATMKFGVIGCLMGTIAALVYRINAYFIYTSKYVREQSLWQSYKKIIINSIIYVFIIFYFVYKNPCGATTYITIMIEAIKHSLWITPLFISINIVVNLNDCKVLFAIIKQLIKDKMQTNNTIGE